MQGEPGAAARIEAVRAFNRFYTRKIGVLREGLLGSPFSLPEARVLYEIARSEAPVAADLAQELELDAGYLSRLLAGLARRGLITRARASDDRRRHVLSLTEDGNAAFSALDAGSRAEIGNLLGRLGAGDQARLVAAMGVIRALLEEAPHRQGSCLLRPHRAGDMGWVVCRHGEIYAEEYGWDERFEALVARIVADFVDGFDPKRERCWIAERDGERMGSVFLVRESDEIAKLRLLLVEPRARGEGLGGRLVEACLRFARRAGYREVTLWTNDVLHAARRVYERAGFRLTGAQPHRSFGHDLIGQTWSLRL
jgi:DNA-binding MarR family transcriptional regulator/GNAT superfamily N-acetyltransferase